MKRTIGKLAAEAGVGVETTRYYEREGLLPKRSGASGWREYDKIALNTISYIKQAQRLGFSLADVKRLQSELIDSPAFCAAVRKTALERLAIVESEVRHLLEQRREIRSFIDRCASVEDKQRCPIAHALLRPPLQTPAR